MSIAPKPLQLGPHVGGVLITKIAVFLKGPGNDVLQLGREHRIEPNWRHRVVLLDSREVDVVPAQLAFSAIPVPAGSHRIEWRESFPGWSVSRVSAWQQW